jgi:hypothetical protein
LTPESFQIHFFDPEAPVSELSGNLPHWRQDGTTYFVTFRLADALPQEKLFQWRDEMKMWKTKNPEPHANAQREEFAELFPKRMQHWLDAGYGSRILELPEVNKLVVDALRFFDGKRYALDEFIVASNHVHTIVTPLSDFELAGSCTHGRALPRTRSSK